MNLNAQENLFRYFIEEVKDYAIFMLEPDGRVASWNKGAARIKGYEAEEVIGKHFSIFYPQSDIAAGKCEEELAIAGATGRFEEEGWRIAKGGKRFWANVVITAVRDRAGTLLGYSKVTRDLSERKLAEDQFTLAMANLEAKVVERTAGLRKANLELQKREAELNKAVRVRDDFITIASHELKTPITSLKLHIQMLQNTSKRSKDLVPGAAVLEKFFQSALRQVERLVVLIDELLDVSQATLEQLSFHFERADLTGIVTDVLKRLESLTRKAGCSIDVEAPNSVVGSFDRTRIEQLLTNLIGNAIKFAPDSRISVSVQVRNRTAILAIANNGPEIPSAEQKALFNRFERGPSSKNLSGLGLGLFLSREIAVGHGGSIRVESGAGTGTAFIVELPLNQAVAA